VDLAQLLLLFLSLPAVTLTVTCKRIKTRAVDFIWVFSPFRIFSWSSSFSDLFHFCSRIFSVHLISAGGRTSSCGRIVGGRTCGCSHAWGTTLWCAAGGWHVAKYGRRWWLYGRAAGWSSLLSVVAVVGFWCRCRAAEGKSGLYAAERGKGEQKGWRSVWGVGLGRGSVVSGWRR